MELALPDGSGVRGEAGPGTPSGGLGKTAGVYGDHGWSWLDAAWAHERATRRARQLEEAGQPLEPLEPLDEDVGNIAIIQDNGDLVVPSNLFDLRGKGVRFSPNANGGYDIVPADTTFRNQLGSRLALADDDTAAFTVPFTMPFFGRDQAAAYVNSDGNITFEESDVETTPRNVTRFLAGPPRIAAFFSDLDPSAGGAVFVNPTPDAFVVTYCYVRGFESQRSLTAQAVLLPSGAIEVKFGDNMNLLDAVVGLSPGRTTSYAVVDLSAAPAAGGSAAVGERFAQSVELDTVAVARRFLATHPDAFDQLVIWADQRVVIDAFAYEMTIKNDIRGLGIEQFDESSRYGASGRLSSVVVMDNLGKYPDDPLQKFLGENNTVSVVGQETGHRWLVFFRFRDPAGGTSNKLLGRDTAHWGFFVDSDGSVMEGNDIEEVSPGSFRTVGAVNRYSLMDQYGMGLVGESDVPPLYYVESPTNITPPVVGDDAEPQIGVTFGGTRRDVPLADIIAVMGRRQPSAASSPRLHHQAFIYVVGRGRQADPSQVGKLDRIRVAWEDFYARAVDGRGRADTRLR